MTGDFLSGLAGADLTEPDFTWAILPTGFLAAIVFFDADFATMLAPQLLPRALVIYSSLTGRACCKPGEQPMIWDYLAGVN
jgi:hypothetical protein